MSSLRLALKQSLAETGHLAPQQKDKSKRKENSNRQRKGGRRSEQGSSQRQHVDVKKRKRREQAAAARRAQQQSLSSHLEAGGGHGNPTIRLSGSRSGHRSVSSSTLSSSSGSSSDSDSNSDDGSSSSSDDSQASSSGSDSNSNDGSSSDDQSSSGEEEHEFQDGMFESDSSSDDDDSDDENASAKRNAKKQKRKAHRNSAANKIQTQWKKSARSAAGQSKSSSKHSGKSGSGGAKKSSSSSSKAQTVEPPSADIIAWMREMPTSKQRRAMVAGLRVKVRFVTKSNRKGKDGKSIRKLKWYGGLVTDVSTGGKRIRIKYDDGTSEVADFPDKDILVDCTGNGRHRASPEDFCPPMRKSSRTSSPTGLERNEKRQHILSEITVSAQSEKAPVLPTKPIGETSESKEHDSQRQPMTQSSRPIPSNSKPSAVSESPYSVARNSVSSSSSSASSSSSVTSDHAYAQHDTLSSQKVAAMPRPSHIHVAVNSSSSAPLDAKQKVIGRGSPVAGITSGSSRGGGISMNKSPIPNGASPKPSLTIRINPPKIKKTNSDNRLLGDRQKQSPKDLKTDISDVPKLTSSPLFSESEAGDTTQGATNEKGELDPVRKIRQNPREERSRDQKSSSDQTSRSDASDDGQHNRHSDHEKNVHKPSGRNSPVPSIKRRNSPPFSSPEAEPPGKRANTALSTPFDLDDQVVGSPLASETDQLSDGPKHAKKLSLKRPRATNKLDGVLYSSVDSNSVEQRDTKVSMSTADEVGPVGKHDELVFTSKPNSSSRIEMLQQSPVPSVLSSSFSGESLNKRKRKREKELSSSPAPTRRNSGSKSPRRESESSTEIPSAFHANTDARPPKSRPIVGLSSSGSDDVDLKEKKVNMTVSANNDILDSPSGMKSDPGSSLGKKHIETIPIGPSSAPPSDFEEKSGNKAGSVPTSRSGRKAAQKANARIVSKEEKVIVDEYAKPKKRKEKPDLKLFPSFAPKRNEDGGSSDDEDIIEEERWVQCDRCEKWRLLPSTVQMDKLPDRWYCELNVYDPKRSSCNASEQTADEIKRERRRAKKKRALAVARSQSSSDSKLVLEEGMSEPGQGDQAGCLERRNISREGSSSRGFSDNQERKINRSTSNDTLESDLDSSDDDVSKSSKESKPYRPSEKVPQNQSRSSITDDISQSGGGPRKNATQITSVVSGKKSKSLDDSVGLNDSKGDFVATSKSKNSSRNRNRPRSSKESDKSSKSSKGNKQNGKETESQQWVQCERCEKWRRLPPRMSPEDLPDVWYCRMNTWDANTASCTAEEDKLDSNVREYTITAGANLNGPSTNSGKLSYRNLIFGTGRKQNRNVSEKTRAAESLFSTLSIDATNEGNAPPTVMYANSSAFQCRSSHMQRQNSSTGESDKSTFLDLMNHSHLWAELYGGAYAIQALRREQPLFKSNEDFIRSMKALVYHMLGDNTLAGHEVLFNVQCSNSHEFSKEWTELRAYCTLELITFALEELVREGLLKIVHGAETGSCGIDVVRYCRIDVDSTASHCKKAVKHSRCMKIAKPWKKTGIGST